MGNRPKGGSSENKKKGEGGILQPEDLTNITMETLDNYITHRTRLVDRYQVVWDTVKYCYAIFRSEGKELTECHFKQTFFGPIKELQFLAIQIKNFQTFLSEMSDQIKQTI